VTNEIADKLANAVWPDLYPVITYNSFASRIDKFPYQIFGTGNQILGEGKNWGEAFLNAGVETMIFYSGTMNRNDYPDWISLEPGAFEFLMYRKLVPK
jgi:hypothetical protein